MHEFSVAQALFSIIESRLGPDDRLVEALVRKGELRNLSEEALRQAFEILARGEAYAGATIRFETVPVALSCRACGYRGPASQEDFGHGLVIPVLACPDCGGAAAVTTGNELELRRLVIDTPDSDDAPAEDPG